MIFTGIKIFILVTYSIIMQHSNSRIHQSKSIAFILLSHKQLFSLKITSYFFFFNHLRKQLMRLLPLFIAWPMATKVLVPFQHSTRYPASIFCYLQKVLQLQIFSASTSIFLSVCCPILWLCYEMNRLTVESQAQKEQEGLK